MALEHWPYRLPLRLRSLFRRARVEQELAEEIQFVSVCALAAIAGRASLVPAVRASRVDPMATLRCE